MIFSHLPIIFLVPFLYSFSFLLPLHSPFTSCHFYPNASLLSLPSTFPPHTSFPPSAFPLLFIPLPQYIPFPSLPPRPRSRYHPQATGHDASGDGDRLGKLFIRPRPGWSPSLPSPPLSLLSSFPFTTNPMTPSVSDVLVISTLLFPYFSLPDSFTLSSLKFLFGF